MATRRLEQSATPGNASPLNADPRDRWCAIDGDTTPVLPGDRWPSPSESVRHSAHVEASPEFQQSSNSTSRQPLLQVSNGEDRWPEPHPVERVDRCAVRGQRQRQHGRTYHDDVHRQSDERCVSVHPRWHDGESSQEFVNLLDKGAYAIHPAATSSVPTRGTFRRQRPARSAVSSGQA